MIQRFITLGEGYGDFYELKTLIEHMPHRVKHLFAFHTVKKNEDRTSLAASFEPTVQGSFQPIYICLEGIPRPKEGESNTRYDTFQKLAQELDIQLIEMDVPPSTNYHEDQLFFQQLISILRLNHLLPPM